MENTFNYQSPLGSIGIKYNDLGITWIGFKQIIENKSDINNTHLNFAIEYLDCYFQNREIPSIPALILKGSDHQLRVWQYLLRIRYGHTVTYGDIAKAIGSSPRAVGQAVGANPISIIVPCHRVVASNGIGGYHWGLDIKQRLLEIETSRGANR